MGSIKTALVHNIVTPYRTVLFDALAAHEMIDLHVFYCGKSHEKRNWNISDTGTHDHSFLPGVALDRGDLHYHINPTVVTELMSSEFDSAIIAGSTNFTMQLGFAASKANLDGTILWTERIRPTENIVGKVVNPITRSIAKYADSIVVPTSLSRQFQESRGIDRNQVFVAPNVVDNTNYYRNRTERGKIRVLFIGQLIERKGVPYLLEAFDELEHRETELVIVGDGPKREAFEQSAREKGIDVVFTGWVSEERKRKELADADLFVLPSLEDLAPLVLNEAMASGLPVLTTEGVGNAADMIIEGGNGEIVPTEDTPALSRELSKLLSDREELNRMGDRSQRILDERFSPESSANQFATAIEAALN
ncbi:glycosyltransferase family 4 protein [Halosimplex salinum]|uniref:glycosyltransferase family 4 protein n=1 Tax=Halosimplex salinum TaxID=1710538 RepID=UPI000F4A7D93|nr:glycosyltransferase family 4 protein [Halosimplex salinum]